MRNITLNLVFLALGMPLWTGCAVLPTNQPPGELASLQNQRAVNALFAVSEMAEIDVLIKLDNRRLTNQFENVIRAQAASTQRCDLQGIGKTATAFT